MKILIVWLALIVFFIGWLIPEPTTVPVLDANKTSWNPASFWYEPWGDSVTHKGIDIFANAGTPVVSATNGLVLFSGELSKGGKVVLVLGPKWRLHYYAHLQTNMASTLSLVSESNQLGTVGSSGNAAGKPAHLHYTLFSMVPLPWCKTEHTQGWMRMFYLDPGKYLLKIPTLC